MKMLSFLYCSYFLDMIKEHKRSLTKSSFGAPYFTDFLFSICRQFYLTLNDKKEKLIILKNKLYEISIEWLNVTLSLQFTTQKSVFKKKLK